MRASKAVTNIVGQLPFSCVCLCICHVSDTIIVYIKAESWVHIAFLSLSLSLCYQLNDPSAIFTTMTATHFLPQKSPFFYLFILTGVHNFFLCRFRSSQKGQTSAVESPITRNLSSWIYTQRLLLLHETHLLNCSKSQNDLKWFRLSLFVTELYIYSNPRNEKDYCRAELKIDDEPKIKEL